MRNSFHSTQYAIPLPISYEFQVLKLTLELSAFVACQASKSLRDAPRDIVDKGFQSASSGRHTKEDSLHVAQDTTTFMND